MTDYKWACAQRGFGSEGNFAPSRKGDKIAVLFPKLKIKVFHAADQEGIANAILEATKAQETDSWEEVLENAAVVGLPHFERLVVEHEQAARKNWPDDSEMIEMIDADCKQMREFFHALIAEKNIELAEKLRGRFDSNPRELLSDWLEEASMGVKPEEAENAEENAQESKERTLALLKILRDFDTVSWYQEDIDKVIEYVKSSKAL